MSESDLSFHQLAHRLRLDDLAQAEPSADLWQKIASAHQRNVRRARVRRGALWGGGCAVVLAALIGAAMGWSWRAQSPVEVDWQARAQALELQLRALNASAPAQASNTLASDAQNELLLVDVALQTAYDDGAEQQQVSALWKRRSELLSALVNARRQNMEISRI
jgi:autotransporter translocation and assembly factor TamB